ncbi:MAG: DUF86 domain-containing protein [Desulfobacteraceae bacterium]
MEDILDALERIFEYVQGMDYDSWSNDRKTMDAVVRNLEIIGEAAANVPENIQEQFDKVPWYQMKGMRNILIHEYFGLDDKVIWKTIQNDLPSLKETLRKLY